MADGGGYSPDEIRERTDLVEVVSSYVALKQAGKRLKGICPFHQDKDPSLTVDPEKQMWYCFGCQVGGNVFHFVMKIENATFVEAARLLARRAGLALRERRVDPKQQSEREALARINDAAAAFFRANLAGSVAQRYLESRGIAPEWVEKFDLGYAPPGWESLLGHLRQKGYRLDDITKAGLCLPRPSGEGAYDRFRDRLMFPIRDLEGRVLGFGGRALEQEEDEGAKYINTPETPLFRKGRTLYGLPMARRAMGESDRAIIVEGYFDCIVSHQYGFQETVATMGTALTEEHIGILGRYTRSICTAFDGDSAGMRATLRGRPMFDEAGLGVRVARLPAGRDPDSFLNESGPESFAGLLDQAPGIVDYQLDTIAGRYDLGSDEAGLRFVGEAVEVLVTLRDAVAQTHYARRVAEMWCRDRPERVGAVETAVLTELRRRARSSGRRRTKAAEAKPGPPSALTAEAAGGARRAEREVLTAILHCDEVIRNFLAELEPEDFADPVHREVFSRARPLWENQAPGDLGALFADAGDDVARLVSQLALDESGLEDERAAGGAVARIKERRPARRLAELKQRIARGEIAGRDDPLFVEYMDLLRAQKASLGERVLGPRSEQR